MYAVRLRFRNFDPLKLCSILCSIGPRKFGKYPTESIEECSRTLKKAHRQRTFKNSKNVKELQLSSFKFSVVPWTMCWPDNQRLLTWTLQFHLCACSSEVRTCSSRQSPSLAADDANFHRCLFVCEVVRWSDFIGIIGRLPISDSISTA